MFPTSKKLYKYTRTNNSRTCGCVATFFSYRVTPIPYLPSSCAYLSIPYITRHRWLPFRRSSQQHSNTGMSWTGKTRTPSRWEFYFIFIFILFFFFSFSFFQSKKKRNFYKHGMKTITHFLRDIFIRLSIFMVASILLVVVRARAIKKRE